jgi:hypothetical protein
VVRTVRFREEVSKGYANSEVPKGKRSFIIKFNKGAMEEKKNHQEKQDPRLRRVKLKVEKDQ